MKVKPTAWLACAVLVLALIDGVTTKIGISLGFSELNPVGRYALSLPDHYFWLIKLGGTALMLGCLLWLSKSLPTVANGALVILMAWLMRVCIINTSLIV